MQLEYLLKRFDSNKSKQFRSIVNDVDSENFDEQQVTFNEGDKTNFLASQEAYEEINQLREQIQEKVSR